MSVPKDILDYVRDLSVRATNLCREAGLITKEQLLGYYKEHGDFYEFRNCGRKTNFELIQVCMLLDPGVKVTISPSFLEIFGNLHIRHLMSLLKSKDCRYLIRKGILTIKDFAEDPTNEFQQTKNLIKESKKRLRSLIKDVNKYEAIALSDKDPVKEAFAIFRDMLSPLQEDIIKYRLLAPKENKMTLVAIGFMHKITRERIRQLEKIIIRDMVNFFCGDVVNDSYLVKGTVTAILQHLPELKESLFVDSKFFKDWAEKKGLMFNVR